MSSSTEIQLETLTAIKLILEVTDSRLSWDQIPNRHSIQIALDHVNKLIDDRDA